MMSMALLNYTTKISIDKTIGEIQKTLAQHGANAILAEAAGGDGLITSLSFRITVDEQPISFKLPSDYSAVLHILSHDRKVPRSLCTKEQALRVSWRILKVWVDAQMALIETKMVKIEQVFLPYAVQPNNKTVYENYLSNGSQYLALKN